MKKELKWLQWLEKVIQEEIDFNKWKTEKNENRFTNGVVEGLAIARNRVEVAIKLSKKREIK